MTDCTETVLVIIAHGNFEYPILSANLSINELCPLISIAIARRMRWLLFGCVLFQRTANGNRQGGLFSCK